MPLHFFVPWSVLCLGHSIVHITSLFVLVFVSKCVHKQQLSHTQKPAMFSESHMISLLVTHMSIMGGHVCVCTCLQIPEVKTTLSHSAATWKCSCESISALWLSEVPLSLPWEKCR